jgi:hypothetical protein
MAYQDEESWRKMVWMLILQGSNLKAKPLIGLGELLEMDVQWRDWILRELRLSWQEDDEKRG